MNTNMTETDVFRIIIDMVVTGEHSPYNEMLNKTKDIDIDYFENIDRGTNSLSQELNLDLKDVIVDSFEKMADGYYTDNYLDSIVSIIKREANTIEEKNGVNAYEVFLKNLAEDLELYAKGSNIHPGFPKYTNSDVVNLYQEARKISLKEYLLGNNGEDILVFYNALMDNTWWACRDVIVNKTNSFLLGLSDKMRELMKDL